MRLIWVGDMEYKLDEHYMSQSVAAYEQTGDFPLLGMPSGMHVRNPGLSIWSFILIGKVFGMTDPQDLCFGVMVLNSIGLFLFLFFIFAHFKDLDRERWLWALMLMSVSPIVIHYERKIWAQSILPFLMVFFWWAWMKKDRFIGAFFWGMLGVLYFQIHMSAAFLSVGVFLWTALFFKKYQLEASVAWRGYFLGSILGVIPALPWIKYFLFSGESHARAFHYWLIHEFRFYAYWFTEPFGFHMGNSLAVEKSQTFIGQNLEFFSYPGNFYLVGVAYLIALVVMIITVGRFVYLLIKKRDQIKPTLMGRNSVEDFLISSVMVGYGLLISFSGTIVRRYYLVVAYPFHFLWTARVALTLKQGRKLLSVLVLAQLLISIFYLRYIHENQGAPLGDYGVGYQYQKNYSEFK